MKPEIERKFLVKKFPKDLIKSGVLRVISVQKINQTYIGIGKDDELRVRKLVDCDTKEETFTYTFKKGKGENRLEAESEISKRLYQTILGQKKMLPLNKKRTTARMGNVIIEIDEYTGSDLIVAEVEFGSVEEMNSFVPPEWCRKDVSSVKKYSNKNLWAQAQKKKKKT